MYKPCVFVKFVLFVFVFIFSNIILCCEQYRFFYSTDLVLRRPETSATDKHNFAVLTPLVLLLGVLALTSGKQLAMLME